MRYIIVSLFIESNQLLLVWRFMKMCNDCYWCWAIKLAGVICKLSGHAWSRPAADNCLYIGNTSLMTGCSDESITVIHRSSAESREKTHRIWRLRILCKSMCSLQSVARTAGLRYWNQGVCWIDGIARWSVFYRWWKTSLSSDPFHIETYVTEDIICMR